jgi:hypothetical protein
MWSVESVKIQCTVFSRFWIGSLFFAKTRARKEPEDLNGKSLTRLTRLTKPVPVMHEEEDE